VNPAVAYRVGRISVGLGVQGAAGFVEGVRQHVGPLGTTTLGYRGPSTGVGFQVGVQFAAWDGLTLGVHHRSRMLLGDVLELRAQGAGALPSGMAYRAQVLPDVFTAGLAWRVRRATRVHVEMSLSTWGTGTADVFQSGEGARPAVAFPRRWRDGVAVRGGVEQALYMVAPDLRLRAGAWFQQSPLEWGQTRLDAPLLDQGGLSAGLGWRLYGFSVDAAYLGGMGVPQTLGVAGSEHRLWSMVHGVVVSLGWRWSPPLRAR
jgi:long-chain fatty acid transport protein